MSESKSGHFTAPDAWSGEFDGVRGMLGFSLGRRASLMLSGNVEAPLKTTFVNLDVRSHFLARRAFNTGYSVRGGSCLSSQTAMFNHEVPAAHGQTACSSVRYFVCNKRHCPRLVPVVRVSHWSSGQNFSISAGIVVNLWPRLEICFASRDSTA